MTRPCPGARAVTSRPSWRAPPGATDCHCHVFGPFDRYPLSPGRSYTPPEASVAAYLDMLGTIGLSQTVIVQPSIYGTENAVTLDAVEAIGLHRARAVVVVDESAGAAELEAMAARGARGVRFNAVSGNGVPMEQLERLVEHIAPLGWHVQLYAHAAELMELEPVLRRLPVPLVVDHMGGVKAAAGGVENPGFRALLRLLEGGAWAKLCGYRSSSGPPYADVRADGPSPPVGRARALRLGHRLAASLPPRPVGGAGRRRIAGRPRRLGRGRRATRRAVLVDNPARLYGFADA